MLKDGLKLKNIAMAIIILLIIAGMFANMGQSTDTIGAWTLLPPLVAITLAFITKNVVMSLFVGVLSGSMLLTITQQDTGNVLAGTFTETTSRFINSLADPWNAGIILQVLVIGGIIQLIGKMGGAKAIAEALVKKAKTPRSAQLITWVMGILLFFDDYANALIVGPIMRPVFDKMKISREKLAFIVDATAAPIAGLALVSTWIGLEVGQINDAYANYGIEVEAYGIFLQTIPYRFYNIFMLVFVALTAVTLKEFGPMYKAESDARKGITTGLEENEDVENELEPKEGVVPSIWNALIPIGTLVVSAILSFYFSGYRYLDGETLEMVNNNMMSFESIKVCFENADASVALFESALFTTIVTIALAMIKKIFTLEEGINTWIDGMKSLLITGVILILAWSLNSTISDLGTATYLSEILGDKLSPALVPSLIFILGAIISFSTGTAYGTIGILMPLAIPLALNMSATGDLQLSIISASAVLTGAIFGDHCSPISDTTILSSMGAGCKHINHVSTQITYALFIAFITVFLGYLPAGYGVSVFIIMPVSLMAMYLALRFFGKKVEDATDVA